jgi:trk system potassium uptake protein TrkH
LREREYLRQRYGAIFSSVGIILLIAGGLMLAPLPVLIAYPREAGEAPAFAIPAGCLGLMGLGLRRLFRRSPIVTLSIQEGGVIVFISWIVVILFSAWPFMSVLRLDFSRAVFE